MSSHDGSPAAAAAAPGLGQVPPADSGPTQTQTSQIPFAIYNGCARLRVLAEKAPGYSRSDFAQHLALKHRAVCDTVVELLASPDRLFRSLDRPRLLLIADLNIEIAAMALAEVDRIDVANAAAIRQRLVERLANAPSAEGGAS